MPFIASLGRRSCNVCRTVTPQGGTVYQGDVTGMVWCLACAESSLHKSASGALPETSHGRVTLPASWGRFQPAAVPSWHERGEE